MKRILMAMTAVFGLFALAGCLSDADQASINLSKAAEQFEIDRKIVFYNGFTVRDYGPGIPDDLMEDVYCTYAASTKRDDADMTGGFGLGSKSPWSYTESFTVTSHNNGVKTMYLMSRVSDEARQLHSLWMAKSDDASLQDLLDFKKAKKKSWEVLGFTPQEIDVILANKPT